MKIALIWPKGYDTKYTIPLALAYLKSNISPEKHQIKLFDCALDNISADSAKFEMMLAEFQPEIVGVSCWSPTYYEAIKVLTIAKKINPNVITILGGAHPTTYSLRVMKEFPKIVDFLFRGEAELDFPIFLEEIRKDFPDYSKINGLVYRDYSGKIFENQMRRENNLDAIPLPDYEFIQLQKYIKKGYRFNTKCRLNAPVWATRGCPYRCSFCTAPQQNGKLIRAHSIPYMVQWIKYLYYREGIRQINIIDDNFTFNIGYAKEFCIAMINLNLPDLKFGTPNGIRIGRTDKELLVLMKKAGWEYVVVAPESGSESILKAMQKDLDPKIVPPKVQEIKDAGLKVHGFFIVGFPGETLEDLKKTIALIRECRFNFFFLNNFQPLPGTPIYDILVKNNEIVDGLLPENYSSGKRVYTPKSLKKVNFPKLILKEYIYLAITNPLNIPYMIQTISPIMAIKKVFSNIASMLRRKISHVNYNP